ncbi:hypothetical protein PC39_01755 [Salinisphaera sp. PC39]|uniref:DUF938 domain-containing protein n=1 Tax=Salinisphaera sp. PC39 TaxID=1304156 RepID=UPI003341F0BF
MTDAKPYAAASERNREPILAVLREHFADRSRVLEIGSGTGQHAVHFGAHLPHLTWRTSDRRANHPGIRAWLTEAALPNVLPPLDLDVTGEWPDERYDAAFSANTLHIMAWAEVTAMFAGLDRVLAADATLAIYGPFHYGGRATSDSNARFDASLRKRAPHMGIRDAGDVDRLAAEAGLALVADVAMPANNRCRVWRRTLPDASR